MCRVFVAAAEVVAVAKEAGMVGEFCNCGLWFDHEVLSSSCALLLAPMWLDLPSQRRCTWQHSPGC